VGSAQAVGGDNGYEGGQEADGNRDGQHRHPASA
jgi:hypothetical protein